MNLSGSQFTNFQKLKIASKGRGILDNLARVSTLGMYYDKKALKKKFAEADDPRLEDDEYNLLGQYMGGVDARYANRQNQSSYLMFDEIRKRNKMIELSLQPEVEEVLDTLTDEIIVQTSKDKYFAYPNIDELNLPNIKKEVLEKLHDTIDKEFPRIYRMLNLSRGGGWKLMRNWLIWGKIAFEIVYDNIDGPKKIIGLIPVDPLTLTEVWKDGIRFWVHEPKFGMHAKQRVLHDSQIIHIAWDDEYGRVSYLERLFRPFNIHRIMERTKINWFITNSMFRTMFVIPTAGKGRTRAAKTLSSAMNRYKDDIEFDDNFGTVEINGQATVPANKEYWMVETDSGKPEISNVEGSGHDMSDMANLSFFERRFYKISKVPIDRFDPNSSDAWNLDATSQKRQEIRFNNFVERIRNKWSPVIIKPLIIQIVLSMPELKEDYEILDSIILDYTKLNVFDELSQMDILDKKAEFIQNMMGSVKWTDESGRERSYFSREWLIMKYMGLTDEEIKQNKKMKAKEDKESREMAKETIKEFGEEQPQDGVGSDTIE